MLRSCPKEEDLGGVPSVWGCVPDAGKGGDTALGCKTQHPSEARGETPGVGRGGRQDQEALGGGSAGGWWGGGHWRVRGREVGIRKHVSASDSQVWCWDQQHPVTWSLSEMQSVDPRPKRCRWFCRMLSFRASSVLGEIKSRGEGDVWQVWDWRGGCRLQWQSLLIVCPAVACLLLGLEFRSCLSTSVLRGW